MITRAIHIKHIAKDSRRFDSRFFLNQDALLSLIIEEREGQCNSLSQIANAFNPPVFKRQFCKNTIRAVQYFQSSDVTNLSERSEVYINKAQSDRIKATVKENQILVTGFGTIGNVRLISKIQEGVAFANNVCRIEAKVGQKYGFIYAFMSSKYGKAQMNKNASGSVVRYIEAPGIKKLLIPIFPFDKQDAIHNLIVQAAELRVEANGYLKVALDIFKNEIGSTQVDFSSQSESININNIFSFHSRLDAQFQIIGKKLDKEKKNNLIYRKISELASKIHVGNRAKRNYVEIGIPFLSSSDMMLFNPKRYAKHISPRTTGINNLLVKPDTILISRSGTVGNTVIVGEDLSNVAVSEHALRLEINQSIISPFYVFCYLNTPQGKKQMEASAFGSVIITLNEELIGNIEVPIFSDIKMTKITANVTNYQKIK